MRYDLLLLALLLSTLAFTPCADVLVETGGAEAAAHQAEDSHDHPCDDTADHCTPFCVCSCCGAVTVQPTVAALRVDAFVQPAEPAQRPSHCSTVLYSSYRASAWQPPSA